MRHARHGVVLAVALVAAACGRPWDAESLGARHPVLAGHPEHGLASAHPYVWPLAGRVAFLSCRWVGDSVPVSLPRDASPAERRVLDAALARWESVSGLRFAASAGSAEGGIALRLVDRPIALGSARARGRAVADCRLDPEGDPASARLVAARVELARRSAAGDAWLPEQLEAAAHHELAHALGLQGHGVRDLEPAVRALYALPSGALFHRARVPRRSTRWADRLARGAAGAGWAGPFLRVGDHTARVWWRDAEGTERGARAVDLPRLLDDPGSLLLVPEEATRAWWARLSGP